MSVQRVIKRVIINRRPGKCFACQINVPANEGRAFTKGSGWSVACLTQQCLANEPELLAHVEGEANAARKLHADFSIELPGFPTRDELTLLRSFPGARFDRARTRWTVSDAAYDRTRVLELAAKLKLDVSDVPAVTEESDADYSAALEAAALRVQACADAGRPLRSYQLDGVDFLAGRPDALIGDDMGLGKTIQALVALPEQAAALVVVPNSLKWNWHDECRVWRPDLKPHVCKGRKSFRVPAPGEVVIINYAILPAWLAPQPVLDDKGNKEKTRNKKGKLVDKKELQLPEGMAEALAPCIGIFDEVQKAKNYKAQRSQKVATLCENLGTVWGATGTPLMNRPLDLWGVLSSLGLNWKVFGSFSTFMRCFGGHRTYYGIEFDGPSGPETAERMRRVMLRRTKAEVLKDLPAKQYSTLRVNGMSKAIYKEMDKLLAEWGETLGAKNLPPFEAFSELRAKVATARIPAAIEYAESFEEAGEPLVVFSAHRAPVLALGEREGWEIILGDTPADKRRDIVARFQAGSLKGIALTISAGGEGLTLTKASNMLFVDLDWTPALNTQAEDRIHRIGQSNACNIVRMVSDHDLDRHVMDLLIEKTAVINTAIDGVADADSIELSEAPAVEIVVADEEEYAARIAAIAEREAAAARDKLTERMAKDKWLDREVARCTNGRAGLPTMELTPERIEAIEEGLAYMASICDGAQAEDFQGFNKADTYIGKYLAMIGVAGNEEAARVGHLILTRYPRQVRDRFPILWGDDS